MSLLAMSDARRRMLGRDAIARLRARLETHRGVELAELVAALVTLAGPPAPPPNEAAVSPKSRQNL